MGSIVSLSEYRAHRRVTGSSPESVLSVPAREEDAFARLIRACCDAMLGTCTAIAASLECLQGALGAFDSAPINRELERSRQCRADTAAITRLMDAGDVEGCIRFRDAILSRVDNA